MEKIGRGSRGLSLQATSRTQSVCAAGRNLGVTEGVVGGSLAGRLKVSRMQALHALRVERQSIRYKLKKVQNCINWLLIQSKSKLYKQQGCGHPIPMAFSQIQLPSPFEGPPRQSPFPALPSSQLAD